MKTISKWLAGSAVGVLLGLGLCGLDQALHPGNHDSVGGWISFWGFVLCLISGLILIASLLASLGRALRNANRNKK